MTPGQPQHNNEESRTRTTMAITTTRRMGELSKRETSWPQPMPVVIDSLLSLMTTKMERGMFFCLNFFIFVAYICVYSMTTMVSMLSLCGRYHTPNAPERKPPGPGVINARSKCMFCFFLVFFFFAFFVAIFLYRTTTH